jgi:hypothetical protein
MTKEIIKKEDTKLDLMKVELEEIKRDFSSPSAYNPENVLAKDLYQLRHDKELPKEQRDKKIDDAMQKLGTYYGLENGIWAANLDRERYYQSLTRMRQRIVNDYNCKTSIEFMLADSIVASYWRIMRNESRISILMEEADGKWSLGESKINIIEELNKGIYLANRRLTTNISLLKEIKQPPIKINLKSNTAFIGQNQQFNTEQKNNEAK